jgi:dUTPase
MEEFFREFGNFFDRVKLGRNKSLVLLNLDGAIDKDIEGGNLRVFSVFRG